MVKMHLGKSKVSITSKRETGNQEARAGAYEKGVSKATKKREKAIIVSDKLFSLDSSFVKMSYTLISINVITIYDLYITSSLLNNSRRFVPS